MTLSIRKAGKEDCATIHRLILELAVFEELEHAVKAGVGDIERMGFGERPYFECLLAEEGGEALGFALYSSMSTATWTRLVAWAVPLMGGDAAVRQWHHVMMWFFVVFTIVHVYLVFYHDYVEGRGTTSSMVGGWKFERTEFFHDDEEKQT